MIVYFDTSAFVPLLVKEAGSPLAARLWSEAQTAVSSRLIVVELAAAISLGRRVGRISADNHDLLQRSGEKLSRELTLVDAVGDIVDNAAKLAVVHELRGYDAMHLATAGRVAGASTVFASGDQRLLQAARNEGFVVIDTSGRTDLAE